jgi:hypothetical protein
MIKFLLRTEIKKSICAFIGVQLLCGCQIDLTMAPIETEIALSSLRRHEVDSVQGESVTTGNGYQIDGVFGETTEKKTLSSGYQIEGIFYE